MVSVRTTHIAASSITLHTHCYLPQPPAIQECTVQVPSKSSVVFKFFFKTKLMILCDNRIIILLTTVNKKGTKFVSARKMMPNVNLRGMNN